MFNFKEAFFLVLSKILNSNGLQEPQMSPRSANFLFGSVAILLFTYFYRL